MFRLSRIRSLGLKLSSNGGPSRPPGEYLTAGISDVQFDVTQVHYLNGFSEENITTSITDVTFVVSEV